MSRQAGSARRPAAASTTIAAIIRYLRANEIQSALPSSHGGRLKNRRSPPYSCASVSLQDRVLPIQSVWRGGGGIASVSARFERPVARGGRVPRRFRVAARVS